MNERNRKAILANAPLHQVSGWGIFTNVGNGMYALLRDDALLVRSFAPEDPNVDGRADAVATWFFGAAIRGESRTGRWDVCDFVETDYTAAVIDVDT